MSGRVLLLSRTQPLGVVKAWLTVATLIGFGFLLNGVLLREGVLDLSKFTKIQSLYAMFAGAVIYFSLVTACIGPRARIDDFERSLPTNEQDWLQAEYWSLLRVVLLAFAGAVLGHLIGVLRGLPAWTLGAAVAPFGMALTSVSVGFLLRGKHAHTSTPRLLAILLLMAVPVLVLLAYPEGSMQLAYGAPLVVLLAWWLMPKRLLPSVRAQTAPAVQAVPVGRADQKPHSLPTQASEASVGELVGKTGSVETPSPSCDREHGFRVALLEMRLALTLRSGGWWMEVVSLAAVSSALFIGPAWPLGAGIAVLMTVMARPSPVDETVLQPLRHLPFPRRSLFPVIGIKAVLIPSLAIMAVGMGNSWMASEVDRVSLTSNWDELRRTRGSEPVPSVVMVPAEHWNIAFDDAPIPVALPDGETLMIRPRKAFPGVFVYHEFQLPENCSVQTASEQLARAKRHFHGGDVAAAQIAEGLTLSAEGSVTVSRGQKNDFSGRNRHYRRPILGQFVDAPLYFLPIFGLMAVAALRRYRVRQLPARKLKGMRILGYLVIVYGVGGAAWLFMSESGSHHSQIAIKSMCAAVRSVVPAWVLFALCAAAVWWLWQACAKRFERMEAPPMIPGVPQN